MMPGLMDFPEYQRMPTNDNGGLLGGGILSDYEKQRLQMMMQQAAPQSSMQPQGLDAIPNQDRQFFERFMPQQQGPTLQQQQQGMRDYDALQAQRAGMQALAAGQPMPQQQQTESAPLELFRRGVPTPYGRAIEEMHRHNDMLSASQTQYANDRPIQVFRPGIPNPIWGWGR